MPTILSVVKYMLFCSLIILTLEACQLIPAQPQRHEDTTPLNPGPQAVIPRKGKFTEDRVYTAIPQTGQHAAYAAGDDGHLKQGVPWPAPRFTNHGDNTITDRLTGLMWTQNADMAQGTVAWEEGLMLAAACELGGHRDWRLPNRNEIHSLLDLGQTDPALPKGHPFANVRPSYYWTSTTLANNEDHAWIVHLFLGLVPHDDKAGSHFVWLVRGGRG